MAEEKNSQRKRVLILDRTLDIFTKEEISEGLVGKLQRDFPGKLIILPVANQQHLKSVCKDPEEKYLFIYNVDISKDFTPDQISQFIETSAYVSPLKINPSDSLADYAEKISRILKKYKV